MSKFSVVMLNICMLFSMSGANAAALNTGTVTVTGNLLASSCTISGGGDLTFTLDTVTGTDLPDINSVAGRKEQSIGLICDTGTNVYMTVTGTSVTDEPTIIKNTGTASGVDLQLLDVSNSDTPITLGERWLVLGDTTATTSIPLAAQYIRTGPVGSGTVKANVTYTLDYE